MRLNDLTGMRFGRLLVVSRAKNSGRVKTAWNCKCDCGNETVVIGCNMMKGDSRSCGCLRRELSRQHMLKNSGAYNFKHGEAGRNATTEYKALMSAIARTTNPKDRCFKNYGGRGIAVCDLWKFGDGVRSGYSFFLESVGRKPTPKHSLERIDNDGDYCPENCVWATWSEQQQNKIRITVHNREQLLLRIAKSYNTVEEFTEVFENCVRKINETSNERIRLAEQPVAAVPRTRLPAA